MEEKSDARELKCKTGNSWITKISVRKQDDGITCDNWYGWNSMIVKKLI